MKHKDIVRLLVEYDNLDQTALWDPFFISDSPTNEQINFFFNRI